MGKRLDKLVDGGPREFQETASNLERLSEIARKGNIEEVEISANGAMRVRFFAHIPDGMLSHPSKTREPTDDELLGLSMSPAGPARGPRTPTRHIMGDDDE